MMKTHAAIVVCVLVVMSFGVAKGHGFRRLEERRANNLRARINDGTRGPVSDALYLGEDVGNSTQKDCVFRRGVERDRCPDPDVKIILYSLKDSIVKKTTVDLLRTDWLRTSPWDPSKSDVFIIHGYAGGDDTLPIVVLRDAYVTTGRYNVFLVDWGGLCKPPCYVAAVHNMRTVARCVATALMQLRDAGLPVTNGPDCVGHSLGAHICGLMANYVNFRLNRIIGLDPARPLIKSGHPNRLDPGDARNVQVMHTNAGRYGETGKVGHVDFCVNGGRIQPYCSNTTNEDLCSHIWSICYMAQSLYEGPTFMAEPCSRRCPSGLRPSELAMGPPLPIGEGTPLDASGSYCLKDLAQPFCPTESGSHGDLRCCVKPKKHHGHSHHRRLSRKGNGVAELLN